MWISTNHIVADVKLRCNPLQGVFFMSVHTQNVSVSPFTLSQTDQIPFFFCAIPYHLIDDDIFPQLKGNHIKLLLVIDRYRNLKLKQRKFDQQLISGWTIPVSQQVLAGRCGVKRPTINNLVEELIELGLLEKQLDDKSGRYRYRLTAYKVTSEDVKKMRYQHEMATEETLDSSEVQRLQQEVEGLKERIEADIQPQENEELVEVTPVCQGIEQGGVQSSDTLIDKLKDINITSSSTLADIPQNQQLEFGQGASDFPVTPHKASYDDDVRELTEYWYLHKKARCYGSHHQYRLHNFKGCVNALVTDYNLNRQQVVEVLKVCIQLHVDTPDTPNWYIKHHKGLEYLNMAMAQVTDNPAMADGSSIHQEAKQQLHQYLRTYIQPLIRAGKPLELKDILHHVTIRKPKLVQ
jgi:predicted transcriptional regulator